METKTTHYQKLVPNECTYTTLVDIPNVKNGCITIFTIESKEETKQKLGGEV